jgi:glycosyltransferase involved in cell wall biosynthesis
MVVKNKGSNDPLVVQSTGKHLNLLKKIGCHLHKLVPRATHKQVSPGFSLPGEDCCSADLAEAIATFQPDVVHLHWLCNGFLSLEDLVRIRRPLIWTMHDSWPFTGGCHVPGSCTAYRQQCGRCPLLGSTQEDDLSRKLYRQKRRIFDYLDLTVVCPSHWMAECVMASSLLGSRAIEVIPHGIDTSVFRPIDKSAARRTLGIDEDRTLILFGGMSSTRDSNKGYDLLSKALSSIDVSAWRKGACLMIFGAAEEERVEATHPVTEWHLGHLKDDLSLTIAYAAADVMVVPSRHEAFGQTALEALACGTPVVCFRTTGLVDIVDHQENGYLAEPYDVEDLGRGLLWAIQPHLLTELQHKARLKVEKAFPLDLCASKHMALYRRLFDSSGQV